MEGSLISPFGERKPSGIWGAGLPSGSVLVICNPHARGVRASRKRYLELTTLIFYSSFVGLPIDLELCDSGWNEGCLGTVLIKGCLSSVSIRLYIPRGVAMQGRPLTPTGTEIAPSSGSSYQSWLRRRSYVSRADLSVDPACTPSSKSLIRYC